VQEGMTEAMVAALGQGGASPGLTSREHLAVQFAELMAVNHQQIDDDFFTALKQEFSPAQIIELGMLIGVFIGYGRLLAVLDLETPALTAG
jgi:alkylhydroperoxidase family enzyme